MVSGVVSGVLPVADEGLDVFGEVRGHGFVAALFAGDLARVACVKVILSAMAAQHLARGRDAETLGNSFLGLEFRHSIIFFRQWRNNFLLVA